MENSWKYIPQLLLRAFYGPSLDYIKLMEKRKYMVGWCEALADGNKKDGKTIRILLELLRGRFQPLPWTAS